jgi:hypothetical protein
MPEVHKHIAALISSFADGTTLVTVASHAFVELTFHVSCPSGVTWKIVGAGSGFIVETGESKVFVDTLDATAAASVMQYLAFPVTSPSHIIQRGTRRSIMCSIVGAVCIGDRVFRTRHYENTYDVRGDDTGNVDWEGARRALRTVVEHMIRALKTTQRDARHMHLVAP